MVSRKYSLTSFEINLILRKKNFLNFSGFFCYYAFSDSLKLAFAVSKKIKPKPAKNKIKRQMKFFVSPFLKKPLAKKLVFLVKGNYYHLTPEAIKKDVKNCFLILEAKNL